MERLCLDDRLAAVARWVLPGETMADIGTDHAFLPCRLVSEGICSKAVASDVAQGPYERARQVVAEQGLSEKISVRLGSGLSVLQPKEVKTIVMAGMGGRLICELLQAEPEVASSAGRLVLQPQRNPEHVRGWLAGHGWRIIADDLAKDGKMWYNIIVAEPGSMEVDGDALLYGSPSPGVSPALRREWLGFCRDRFTDIADSLRISRGRSAEARLSELEQEIARLDRIIAKEESC